MKEPTSPEAAIPAGRVAFSRVDVLIPLVLAIAGAAVAVWMTDGLRCVIYDSFRDMAWAENIVAGSVWADPVLRGQTWWYAPGNPILFGLLARIISVPVVDIYRTSALWWNVWILVLSYLLVRIDSDRLTGLLVPPLLWLGSLWWMTHLVSPMPSIQGAVLGLATLLCWHGVRTAPDESLRSGVIRAAATGAVLAATVWFHPVCAVLAAGAVGVHGLAVVLWPRVAGVEGRRSTVIGVAVIGATSLLLSLPVIGRLVSLSKDNPVQMTYFARELTNPDFALQLHAPLVLLFAAYGGWRIARVVPGLWWVLGYLAVAVIGQSLGYLNNLFHVEVRFLLPHEFQWHGQLALAVCAAVGIVHAARLLARRLAWPRERWVALLLWVGGAMVASLKPALPYLAVADAYLVDVLAVKNSRHQLVQWIRNSTSIDAVFACPPQIGHLFVAGLTGRKCVAVPIGHLNPGVDGEALLEDLRRMLDTDDEREFADLADRHAVDYVVVDVDSQAAVHRVRRLVGWPSLRTVFAASDQPSGVLQFVPSVTPDIIASPAIPKTPENRP